MKEILVIKFLIDDGHAHWLELDAQDQLTHSVIRAVYIVEKKLGISIDIDVTKLIGLPKR